MLLIGLSRVVNEGLHKSLSTKIFQHAVIRLVIAFAYGVDRTHKDLLEQEELHFFGLYLQPHTRASHQGINAQYPNNIVACQCIENCNIPNVNCKSFIILQ